MKLKNYTTSVPADKSIMEIDKILNGVKDSAPESWKKQIKKELRL